MLAIHNNHRHINTKQLAFYENLLLTNIFSQIKAKHSSKQEHSSIFSHQSKGRHQQTINELKNHLTSTLTKILF